MNKNLKKVISSAAALAIVASSAVALATTFPDVDSSASYVGSVDILSALGIVEGDENGKFNPDNTVTRAEFTKMVVEARGEGDSATALTSSKFNDAATTTQHWAAGYIAQGVADGFIDGYSDTEFGPNDTVTYAQAVKMLVAAIGYDSYAKGQGGWPTGYLSQGSSLKITNGVNASNDTALTRAQCAILVSNALKAPLCVEDGYDSIADGKGGYVQVPNLVVKDGYGKGYQTLLTEKHDAYVVKGRVMATSKDSNSGLDKNEVNFNIELADNFDDEAYAENKINYNAPKLETMYAGDTAAEAMLFSYSEAIVQKDEDTSEYTILAIEEYGKSRTVTVAADDVSNIASDFVYDQTTGVLTKLPVFKSAQSNATTKYDLSVAGTNTADCVMYVNGTEAGKITAQNVAKYITNNQTGTITLIDSTKTGSTSTDGKYDYILVDYYIDGVVDSTTTSSTTARVYMKTNVNGTGSTISWDYEDEDIDITFTLDGEEIDYTELQEYDVLSIPYDVENPNSFTNLEYANIEVSRNQVTGTLTGRDTDNNILKINGEEYELATASAGVAADYNLSTEYTLYLDKFGYVAYADEGTSSKNYGVVVGMYKQAGEDFYTVRLVTADGDIETYVCKDTAAENAFFTVIGESRPANGGSIEKATLASKIKDCVVEYRLSSGKISVKTNPNSNDTDEQIGRVKVVNPNNATALEYKAAHNKVGNYTITDGVTRVVDMEAYLAGSDNDVKTMSVSDFEDGANYSAYVYDRNNNGDYRFVMVMSGTSSIRPESVLSVVKKNNGQTTSDDGDDVTSYSVVRGANSDLEAVEEILVSGNDSLEEGAVITYVKGSDGIVDAADIYTLFAPAGRDYSTLLTNVVSAGTFANVLEPTAIGWHQQQGPVASRDGGYAINYEKFVSNNGTPDDDTDDIYAVQGSTNKDVYAYFGVMYRTSGNRFEIFTASNNGISTTDFNVTDETNVVHYNFENRANQGGRVSRSVVPAQSSVVFNNVYANADKTAIDWNAAVAADDCEPSLVFVKTVDGDATDVVVYTAR